MQTGKKEEGGAARVVRGKGTLSYYNASTARSSTGGGGETKKDNAFTYCEICRRNHQQGWGHVYTKIHLERLGKVLDKALAKMAEVRQILEKPVLIPSTKPGWCIICQKEIETAEQLNHEPMG